MENILYKMKKPKFKSLEGSLEKTIYSVGAIFVFVNVYQLAERIFGKYL